MPILFSFWWNLIKNQNRNWNWNQNLFEVPKLYTYINTYVIYSVFSFGHYVKHVDIFRKNLDFHNNFSRIIRNCFFLNHYSKILPNSECIYIVYVYIIHILWIIIYFIGLMQKYKYDYYNLKVKLIDYIFFFLNHINIIHTVYDDDVK